MNPWVRFQHNEKITVTTNTKHANFETAQITPLEANIVFLVYRANSPLQNLYNDYRR